MALQEKRLRGLGVAVPDHAVLQAKRDLEWKEFLAGRAPNSSGGDGGGGGGRTDKKRGLDVKVST